MKIHFEAPKFNVIQIGERYGISLKTVSVAVLPYTVNGAGIVDKIGVLHEFIELREGNYADTLITGTIDDTDADAYATAVRELLEEGGIDMKDEPSDKWTFLGNFHDSKDTDRIIPTFAVDVTGMPIGKPATDGSESESKSAMIMMDVNEALQSNELLLLGSFLRLFNIMYHKSFTNGK